MWVLLYLLRCELQGAVLLLRDNKDLPDEFARFVVEDACRIECLPLDARLEVEVVAGSSSCPAFYADRVARLEPLPNLDQIARVMAVERLQPVGMTQDDTVPIGKIRTGENDLSREGCPCRVASEGLDVCPAMMPLASERTRHSGSRQGIVPLLLCIVGKVYRELVALLKWVFRSLHLHHLPLVNVNPFVLSQ